VQGPQQAQLQERQTDEHVSPTPVPDAVLSFVRVMTPVVVWGFNFFDIVFNDDDLVRTQFPLRLFQTRSTFVRVREPFQRPLVFINWLTVVTKLRA